MKAKKALGQNFLVEAYHLNTIAKAIAFYTKDSWVIEFGPGTGNLTAALLELGLKVYAIEKDKDLIPVLEKRFEAFIQTGQFCLKLGDGAQIKPADLPKGPFVLCGNLPYYMTSSFLFLTLDWVDEIRGAVYLMQAEVAQRICANPGSRVYGMPSVLTQALFEVDLVHKVPKGAFRPVPKVESAVIALTPKPLEKRLQVPFEAFKRLVKTAFLTRRKTLVNCLKMYPNMSEILKNLQIDEKRRPETLSYKEFEMIVSALL